MSATAAQIAQLRRMTAERTTENYSDVDMQGYIETYPLVDANGLEPRYYQASTKTMVENLDWMPTYDLHAAAADIWEEKAANASEDTDFEADGGKYSDAQVYDHAMKQVRYHRSRRSPKTIQMSPAYPVETVVEEMTE
jgi:hypothetical protein